MANIIALKAELDSDPLGRGYALMTDFEVAESLNAVNRDIQRSLLSGDEVFNVTDSTEFGGLTAHKQLLWLSFSARADIDPFGAANVGFVQFIFGGGSATAAALVSLRTVTNGQSRAQEINLGTVREGTVAAARAQ